MTEKRWPCDPGGRDHSEATGIQEALVTVNFQHLEVAERPLQLQSERKVSILDHPGCGHSEKQLQDPSLTSKRGSHSNGCTGAQESHCPSCHPTVIPRDCLVWQEPSYTHQHWFLRSGHLSTFLATDIPVLEEVRHVRLGISNNVVPEH